MPVHITCPEGAAQLGSKAGSEGWLCSARWVYISQSLVTAAEEPATASRACLMNVQTAQGLRGQQQGRAPDCVKAACVLTSCDVCSFADEKAALKEDVATKQRELDRVRLEKHVQKGQYEAQVNNLVSSLDTLWRSRITVRWHTRASLCLGH